MANLPDWLPDLIRLEDYGGDWQRYEDAIYSKFYTDFIASKPLFQNIPVYIKGFLENGKERGFWHCIQEGPVEENRTPDLRRCERIAWIRTIIEHASKEPVKTWPKQVRGRQRQCIWLKEADYLIILEKRKSAWVLWTAYPTTEQHTKRKLLNEYESTPK